MVAADEEMNLAAKPLFGMTLAELQAAMKDFGQPAYRAKQLSDALYRQRVVSLDEMTTLPIELRDRMNAAGYVMGLPEIVQTAKSIDGTERYLMRMADGESVETVWMPEGDGGERGDGSEAAEEEASEPDLIEAASESPYKQVAEKPGAPSIAVLSRWVGSEPTTKPGAPSIAALPRWVGSEPATKPGAPSIAVSSRWVGSEPTTKPGAPSIAVVSRWVGSEPATKQKRLQDIGTLEKNGYRRATICISSQVGCAVNCQFCLTAKLGIKRNLTAGEIAGQVAAVASRQGIVIGKDRINLVFMGMGEPFLNYDAFMASVRLLSGAMGLPESRMTVSTSGIEPAIRRFAQEPVRPKLALSLNASNDTVRAEIMPITRKWNIAALLDAVATIPMGKREYCTFEYVLLGGINDQPEHAREVLALLRKVKSKVNLIVWNPGPGIAYRQPRPEDVAIFQKLLIDGGMPTYIRRPRGRDIYAACGQLKRTLDEPLVNITA